MLKMKWTIIYVGISLLLREHDQNEFSVDIFSFMFANAHLNGAKCEHEK